MKGLLEILAFIAFYVGLIWVSSKLKLATGAVFLGLLGICYYFYKLGKGE
jgi:hypothetical protein